MDLAEIYSVFAEQNVDVSEFSNEDLVELLKNLTKRDRDKIYGILEKRNPQKLYEIIKLNWI